MTRLRVFDFRSDTVTRPNEGMRQAIYQAEVGDDVYGEDSTVNALEERVADLLGKQSALFVSSGTQANLIAILSHTKRGDEFITGHHYHSHFYEAGGAAVLGGVVPCPVPVNSAGQISEQDVLAAIKPDDVHHPVSRLLCLENTVNGRIQPVEHLHNLCQLAHDRGLSTHLDGARLMNAAVAEQRDVKEITAGFDSVSLCLSKGLGTPAGSVLCGTRDFIRQARRWRKMLGGGMRQIGLLAAAGHYALDHNIDRLAEDHAHARLLAEKLANLPTLELSPESVDTNMVYLSVPAEKTAGLPAFLKTHDLIISPAKPHFRLVVHKDITQQAIEKLAEKIEVFVAK